MSIARVVARLGSQTRLLNSPIRHAAPQHAIWRDAYIYRRFHTGRPAATNARDASKKPADTPPAHNPSDSGDTPQKSLYDRLPHLHRPTKEELLSAATGFWHRLSIRFKWFSIRSARPFNADDISAFLSWIFWGHILWFVIGTTTFVSLAIWFINTVFAQETLAGLVGNYLTQSSGLKIVFESAIVPTWRDGVITFNNVFVSRRPQAAAGRRQRTVRQGSTTEAAAAAEAASLQSPSNTASEVDDGNYTQFDVTIQTVHVTLSFAKWFNGKGLLRSVSVRGVRGVIDRTHVHPVEGESNIDPKSYRHTHNPGDFEIDDFRMEDVLLTVYQPNGFRPFTVSVYNCELPRLRKQWLFYDFLAANNMSGSFDDSLFTIHPRQAHGLAADEEKGQKWWKHSRLRIDHLRIDHLNRGVEGPFSWIQEGNVDIVADVMLPGEEEGSIAKVMADFYDRVEATVGGGAGSGKDDTIRSPHHLQNHDETSGHRERVGGPTQRLLGTADGKNENHGTNISSDVDADDPSPILIFDINCNLNAVHATIPLFTKDLSYVNNALIRPIVAYINTHPTRCIPVSCRVIKHRSEFDGSWTIFDSGLLDDLSRETYEAFARDIADRGRRRRRVRQVGIWGLRVAAQALFLGLAGGLA